MPLISISLLEQLLCKPLRARVALTRTRKQQHERARPHKRQQGQSKWQSYSEGWKPHNTPHCLSANRFAPCHFPLQTHEGERKLFFFLLFPPVDISPHSWAPRKLFTPSLSRLPPLVVWSSRAVAHCSSWQCPPLFLPLTYTQAPNLFHFHSNFQMNFTGVKRRGPFTSPLHHLSTSESFIGMIQWQQLFHFLLPPILISLSPSWSTETAFLATYKHFNIDKPKCGKFS